MGISIGQKGTKTDGPGSAFQVTLGQPADFKNASTQGGML